MNANNDINFKLVYLRMSANSLADVIVTGIVSIVITSMLFLMASWLWAIYGSTNIGQIFTASQPALAEDINKVLTFECIKISIHLNLLAVVSTLILGAAAQLLHVHRHFYASMGHALRILVWGCGISYFVSLMFSAQYSISHFWVSFVCATPPTVMLLKKSFAFAETVLPEIGGLISKIMSKLFNNIQELLKNMPSQIKSVSSDEDNNYN